MPCLSWYGDHYRSKDQKDKVDRITGKPTDRKDFGLEAAIDELVKILKNAASK
jgi:hypothetical protein